MRRGAANRRALLATLAVLAAACKTPPTKGFHDENMDFGSIKTVAVLPFANMTADQQAPERVRDVFANMLLATNAFYVLPHGEVMRGVQRANLAAPWLPGKEDVVKLGSMLTADAVIVGSLKEYGELRSATTGANTISLSLQMIETQTGRVVWSASTTKGGVRLADRLLGGGGEPMNRVTEEAVNELLDKLFK